jgi:hypothetical protein
MPCSFSYYILGPRRRGWVLDCCVAECMGLAIPQNEPPTYYNYLILTAIGLTPGGSSTVHILHTNSTQNTENGTYITIKRKKLGKCGTGTHFS